MSCHAFLMLLLLVGEVSSEMFIKVDPSPTAGNQSLEYHLCSYPEQLQSNTTIALSPGRHSIGKGDPCIVSHIDTFTIRGNSSVSNVELICTNSFIGRIFVFLNITNLTIENVVITNCGDFIPQSLAGYVNGTYVTDFGENQKTVFLFILVANAYMSNTLMSRNFGYGLIGVNLQGDTVLDQVKMVLTTYKDHPCCGSKNVTDFSCSGSGAYFLYTDPSTNTSYNATFSPANTTLTVSNSLFHGNSYSIPLVHYLNIYTIARSPYQTEKVATIGGTGVTILSGQRSYFLDARIQNSEFTDNGGHTSPVGIIPFNTIYETSYLIENCSFRNNHVQYPGRGGAILVLLLLFIDASNSHPEYPDNVYTMVDIKNSKFLYNECEIGGAVYLHMSPQNVTEFQIRVYNTLFIGNIAQTGSAISANSYPTLFIPRSSSILIEDVVVMNNTFPSNLRTTTSTIDSSAAFIFSLIYNVTITGRNVTGGSLFSSNSPGAILVTGGKIYIRGHLEFTDNFSFRGGAIALYDYTLLYIYEGSRINFTRNHALTLGGAIYANSLGTSALDVCVFQIVGPNRITSADQVDLLDLQIRFESNSAAVAGNSIYAHPLYVCSYAPEASTVQNEFVYNEQDIYNAVFKFVNTVSNGNKEMTSIPDRLVFCNLTTGTTLVGEYTISLSTIPGAQFSINLIPIDRNDTRVQSVLYFELSDESFSLGPTQTIQTHSGLNCTSINFNMYGREGSSVQLYLYARVGGKGLVVDVNLGKCPPGFELTESENLQQCSCSSYVMDVIQTTCNVTTYTIARPGTSWMGVAKNNLSKIEWVITCPIGHCNPEVAYIDLERSDEICDPGRRGVLCGQCKEGLSIVFGTPICTECSNYWLITIVLYAIAGVLLVVGLFVLDLTVTKGTINGLIFYVNIVSVNGGIFFERNASFVRVFISLLNLELGFPICFYDGMTEAARIGLQFVFPTYLLVICLALILLSRWSSRIQKTTSCNSIAVLATLFYLSYGKLLRTVIDCFSFATVSSESGSKAVWLYDGNLEFSVVCIFRFSCWPVRSLLFS